MKGKTSGPKMPKLPTINSDNMEMRVRKISNGYIVQTSGMKGKGKNAQYVSHEAFCPSKPQMSFSGRKK